ncbi:MAG: DNA alkylation repair protein [Anaerolineae bacterium]|nr:DNA alkylation repair protein [Anaerolineae bacterium]
MTAPEGSASVVEQVRAAQARLRANADPERAAAAAPYFPSRPPILGAPSGLARQLGAALARELRARAVEELLQAAELLYTTGVMEDGACANEMLGRLWRRLSFADWDRFEGWLREFTCWGTTDSFCLKVLGHLVLRDGPPVKRLERWATSDGLWLRRAACVSLIRAARAGAHAPLTFRICDRLLDDPEPLVQKALGWTLKELTRADVESVVAFLRARRVRVTSLALRHACQLMSPEQRAQARSP